MIEKMMLVHAYGPMDKLNKLLFRLLRGADIHLENATELLGSAVGFGAVDGESPFSDAIARIRSISETANDPIDDGALVNFIGTGREPTNDYIRTLSKLLEEAEGNFDGSDINVFLSGLKPKIDEYVEKTRELTEREAELTHEIDVITHFNNIDIDLDAVRKTLADFKKSRRMTAQFGFMPKDAMVRLYLLNAEDKFFFRIISRDEKNVWGIRCAVRDNAPEAHRIFDALGFEPFRLPSDSFMPGEQLERDTEELLRVTEAAKAVGSFWEDNRRVLTRDLSLLMDLEAVWRLRSFAAVKDGLFHVTGWISAKDTDFVKDGLNREQGVEYTVKRPEESAAISSHTEPFPFEGSLNDIDFLAREAGAELTSDKLFNILGSPRVFTPEYAAQVSAYLGGGGIGRGAADVIPSSLRGEIRSRASQRRSIIDSDHAIRKKLERLAHFKALGVNVEDITGAKYVTAAFGKLPRKDAEAIINSKNNNFEFEIYSSDERNSWCIWAAMADNADAVRDYFNSLYFKEYDFSGETGKVTEIMDRLEQTREKLNARREQIVKFWNANEHNILMSYSVLLDLQRLWNARDSVKVKNGKYIFTGDFSRDDKREMRSLYEAFGGFEPSDKTAARPEASVPPTKLRNPRLFKPYEYFVEMYGAPAYGSVDITPFVAITYTLLFGVMFGDLGQGAVLILIGIFMWVKKKMALGRILIPCGAAAMAGGLVFGSVFGYEDLLDPLYHAVGLASKPVSVMENINGVLVFAIFTGIALMALSILLNIYTNIRARRVGAALFGTNGVAGLALYACGVSLVYSFMAHKTLIPTKIAAPVMAVSAVILFLQEWLIGIVDRRDFTIHGGISDFIMQNLFELIEYVLSYFSNTVSFLRVGAFVLVHAGMMMVVFSLAGESRNIIVIILGNILITALEGLLSGIQALRLEYYEMFSRCYDGGGKVWSGLKKYKETGLR